MTADGVESQYEVGTQRREESDRYIGRAGHMNAWWCHPAVAA